MHACYKAAKKESRRLTFEVREIPDPETPGVSDPSEWLGDREQLFEAIGRLPVDQRAVMVVHYYLDLPLAKAAEVLDIPVGTAKSRLHHGLTALRRTVRDETVAVSTQAGEGAR